MIKIFEAQTIVQLEEDCNRFCKRIEDNGGYMWGAEMVPPIQAKQFFLIVKYYPKTPEIYLPTVESTEIGNKKTGWFKKIIKYLNTPAAPTARKFLK